MQERELKMYRNKCVAIIFMICIIVFVGCNKKMIFNLNDSNQTTDYHQVKNIDIEKHLNSFFPYAESFSQTFNGRFNFFESVELKTKVNFEKMMYGNNREVWNIIFEEIYWSDGELEFKTENEVRNLGYFFITKNKIFWVKEMSTAKLKEIFVSFIDENNLPAEAVVVCQEDEKPDLDKEKNGIHREIISCGTNNNVRQFSTWYIKSDYSDIREIYSYAFKENIGLISYHGRETQAGLNAVQLWNCEHVKSDELFEDFLYY